MAFRSVVIFILSVSFVLYYLGYYPFHNFVRGLVRRSGLRNTDIPALVSGIDWTIPKLDGTKLGELGVINTPMEKVAQYLGNESFFKIPREIITIPAEKLALLKKPMSAAAAEARKVARDVLRVLGVDKVTDAGADAFVEVVKHAKEIDTQGESIASYTPDEVVDANEKKREDEEQEKVNHINKYNYTESAGYVMYNAATGKCVDLRKDMESGTMATYEACKPETNVFFNLEDGDSTKPVKRMTSGEGVCFPFKASGDTALPKDADKHPCVSGPSVSVIEETGKPMALKDIGGKCVSVKEDGLVVFDEEQCKLDANAPERAIHVLSREEIKKVTSPLGEMMGPAE